MARTRSSEAPWEPTAASCAAPGEAGTGAVARSVGTGSEPGPTAPTLRPDPPHALVGVRCLRATARVPRRRRPRCSRGGWPRFLAPAPHLCFFSVRSCAVKAVTAPDSEVLAHLVLLACPAGFAPQLWQHFAALSVQCHQVPVRLPRIVRTARFTGPDSWHCLRGVVTRGGLGECPPSPRTGVSSSDPLSKSPQKPTQKQEQLAA